MKKIIMFFIFSLALNGCASNGGVDEGDSDSRPVKASKNYPSVIMINRAIPYARDNIPDNILRECKLDVNYSTYVTKYGRKYGINIKQVDKIDVTKKGTYLDLKIVGAVSSGNAFMGHRKAVNIIATLYQDGKKLNSTKQSRASGGGFGGGFKGSCSVLNHVVHTLGSDVVKWVKKYNF